MNNSDNYDITSSVTMFRLPLDVDIYVGILTEIDLGESMTGQQLSVSLVLYVMYCKSPLDKYLYVGNSQKRVLVNL